MKLTELLDRTRSRELSQLEAASVLGVSEHGFRRSYNWLRLTLQAHGRKRAAPRRGAHRRKRPRRALPGTMLHQDGSTHEWVPGRRCGSLVMASADAYKVPAGGALALDREGFAAAVEAALEAEPEVKRDAVRTGRSNRSGSAARPAPGR